MNLYTAENILQHLFSSHLGLRYTAERKGNYVHAKSDVTLKAYGDRGSILLTIDVYESNTLIFNFVFDKLPVNNYTLQLVHNFNRDNIWFRAFIRNDGYLVLAHTGCEVDENTILPYMKGIINALTSDSITNLARPMVSLTT